MPVGLLAHGWNGTAFSWMAAIGVGAIVLAVLIQRDSSGSDFETRDPWDDDSAGG